MVFDPKVYRDNRSGIGMPADSIATDTSSDWTAISLLKSIASKLGVGSVFAPASDVAQGSSTAGQTGGLTQAAVTTAAPSYTTAKTNPLSLKTNGDLRVADTDAATLLTAVAASVDGLETLTGAVTETAPATDTASSGLNGRLQRVAQRLTSLIALFPASLGAKAAAASFAVTQSTEDAAQLGSLTETAPATDTASSGLNGRLQRVAQRITSLIALVPASLGAKTASASLAVTLATDDVLVAPIGIVTETAPATDTASSGLNGRMQRIAQRITSLIGLVPASLGQKAMSASFAVTMASDQAAFPVQPGTSAATGGIASTSRIVSAAASTNGTSAKASAGRVYAIQGYNAASAVRYLKLYNKASAPTVGSDTPVKTLPLPPLAGFAFDWPHGYSLATGIAYALTTGSADADTGALTAADVVGLNVDYV